VANPSTIIDERTETHNYVVEKVTTTLSLAAMGGRKVGLAYRAKYSGLIAAGEVAGGPLEVDGDIPTQVIYDDPKAKIRVTLTVQHFSWSGSHVSMQVIINVTAPVFGSHDIFNQMLGGEVKEAVGWGPMLAAAAAAEERAGRLRS
jgi:hypothetical protein